MRDSDGLHRVVPRSLPPDSCLLAPDSSPGRPPMRRLVAESSITIAATTVMAAVVLFLGAAIAHPLTQPGDWPSASERACHALPLTSVGESGVQGEAHVCIDQDGVQPALTVRGLHANEAYTAWLAYFDRPSACFMAPCG